MSAHAFQALHTSDARHADQTWILLGGRIEAIRRTGEKRYRHDLIERPLRTNGRRHDVPAKLLTLINRLARIRAANDELWSNQQEADPDKQGHDERRAR